MFRKIMPVVSLGCCVARHCAKFSRNLKHSRVNPVPKLEEEAYHQYGVGSHPVCKLQKGCTRLAVACPWSPVLSRYSGFFHHYIWSSWYSWTIAENGVKHQKSINQSIMRLADFCKNMKIGLTLRKNLYENIVPV